MDWIFDHLWVLIAIATVIGRVLMKRKQGDGASGDQPAPPKEYEFEDPELAERTRRIREEIQRKIAERRGQLAQPPPLPPARSRPTPIVRSPEATTPPITPNILLEVLKSKLEPVNPPPRPAATMNMAEESARQTALMEKLKEAESMKASILQRRLAFEATTADQEPAALKEAREVVLDDLRHPQALRRAFVLREVLGPPVALR